ncbi:MAG: tyrosine-type recombinase/integrase [Candidatus Krumholzibacteriia bacterium]
MKDLEPGKIKWLERGIFVRKTHTGQLRYGISYVYKGRRKQEIVGPTKTLAKHALSIRKAEIAQGRYKITPRKRSPLFCDFCETYLLHAKSKKKSWRGDKHALRIAKPFFARKRLNEITQWDIERYRSERLKTRSRATSNRDLSLLRYMFNMAIEWGMLEQNPAKKIRALKVEEVPMRVLTVDEEHKLVEAAADHIRALIYIAVYTGMRRGELLQLDWEDVDFTDRIITVRKSKSGRVRHVPMSSPVVNLFRRIERDYGPVFRFQGKAIKDVKTAFQRAVRESGIKPCRFHDLRHTFATRMVMSGADLHTLKQIMGHASIQTTLKYSHPSPEHRQTAVERMMLSLYGSARKVRPDLKLISDKTP